MEGLLKLVELIGVIPTAPKNATMNSMTSANNSMVSEPGREPSVDLVSRNNSSQLDSTLQKLRNATTASACVKTLAEIDLPMEDLRNLCGRMDRFWRQRHAARFGNVLEMVYRFEVLEKRITKLAPKSMNLSFLNTLKAFQLSKTRSKPKSTLK